MRNNRIINYYRIAVSIAALVMTGLFFIRYLALLQGFNDHLSFFYVSFVISFILLYLLVVGITIWQAAARAKNIAWTEKSNIFNEVFRVSQTAQQSSSVIEVDSVPTEPTAPALPRSLRCKSCGAVSIIEVGKPAICSYCDSPLDTPA